MEFFIDLDGTVFDTIDRITTLYNEDYSYYDHFEPIHPDQIHTWNFDELKLSNRKAINFYFNQPRFFNEELKPFPGAASVIQRLKENGHKIIIVSLGQKPNLKLKKAWLRNNLAFDDFIGVDLACHSNKDHINMSGGTFIDDMTINLNKSNASNKICFGSIYDWNTDWNGQRCGTWQDIYNLFK